MPRPLMTIPDPGGTGAASGLPTEPERIVQDIMHGLFDGRFEPGQRLREADLTNMFGLSRGPVREALNRLAATGIVEMSKKRGAQIRVHTIDEAIDVLEVLDGLARTAVRLAARNIERPGARAALEKSLELFEKTNRETSRQAFDQATEALFATIYKLSGNSELLRIFPTVRTHIINLQFRVALRPLDGHLKSDYRRIAKAVLAGKGPSAEAAIKVHIKRGIDALEAYRSAFVSDV